MSLSKQEIQKEFNSTFQLYSNSINLIDIERRNQSTSEKFFERAKEQFYQGQLSRNDFRLAQIDLSVSKNRLNKTLYKSQFRPMKKGVTNMIRLHATSAIAMPIELRLHILASSKDIIHS